MAAVTDSQIAAARSVDLLSYLQTYEPGSIKKSGPNEYCLREHDSLKISNGKWFWFSRGFGSNNALDFLMQVRGMDFTRAVETLADGRSAPAITASRSPPEKEKPRLLFALPGRELATMKSLTDKVGTDYIKWMRDNGYENMPIEGYTLLRTDYPASYVLIDGKLVVTLWYDNPGAISVPKTGETPPYMNYMLAALSWGVSALCGMALYRLRRRGDK